MNEHDLTNAEREAIALEPDSKHAKAAKKAANERRRALLRRRYPNHILITQDGSMRKIKEGTEFINAAGAAAAGYPHFSHRVPSHEKETVVSPDTCSYWPENIALGSGIEIMGAMMDEEDPEGGSRQGAVIVCEDDSLSNLTQLAKGPAMAKKPEEARLWHPLLQLVDKGVVSQIVMAHMYSHDEGDEAGGHIDSAAKRAAGKCRGEAREEAAHWWKDDARETVTLPLSARAEALLEHTFRGEHGPEGPTKWGKAVSKLSPAQGRYLAQIRVGCCAALGGHLCGRQHAVVCGACGTRVGRNSAQENASASTKLMNPVEHLLMCPEMRDIRAKKDIKDKDVSLLWRRRPEEMLHFIEEAALRSASGAHRAGERLGERWQRQLQQDTPQAAGPSEQSSDSEDDILDLDDGSDSSQWER